VQSLKRIKEENSALTDELCKLRSGNRFVISAKSPKAKISFTNQSGPTTLRVARAPNVQAILNVGRGENLKKIELNNNEALTVSFIPMAEDEDDDSDYDDTVNDL
jgi:hypothetical protein